MGLIGTGMSEGNLTEIKCNLISRTDKFVENILVFSLYFLFLNRSRSLFSSDLSGGCTCKKGRMKKCSSFLEINNSLEDSTSLGTSVLTVHMGNPWTITEENFYSKK